MTSIHEMLTAAKRRIALVSDTASLDAQLLLAEVLDCNRAHLIAHPERILTPEQAALYERMVARRAQGEPVAYILGRKAFYDREFIVTPAVLIPRPETEHLLEFALEFLATWQKDTPPVVVDVGTGSGALAVTLAAHVPGAKVYATDISPDALRVARMNAEKYGVTLTFLEGDLLAPLIERAIRVDVIMANLPYIASGEVNTLAVSKHEPRLALDGGADGLDSIRRLLEQAPSVVKPGGGILLEIGAGQGADVAKLATQLAYAATLHKDYAGHDRVVAISRPLAPGTESAG